MKNKKVWCFRAFNGKPEWWISRKTHGENRSNVNLPATKRKHFLMAKLVTCILQSCSYTVNANVSQRDTDIQKSLVVMSTRPVHLRLRARRLGWFHQMPYLLAFSGQNLTSWWRTLVDFVIVQSDFKRSPQQLTNIIISKELLVKKYYQAIKESCRFSLNFKW